jgi:hypothetical protein
LKTAGKKGLCWMRRDIRQLANKVGSSGGL